MSIKVTAIVDWKPIAKKCNTTVGAAAARFYRMRKAWEKEKNEGAATTDTTYKAGATGAASTPKRKRAPPAKKTSPKPSADDDGEVPCSDEEPASASESLDEDTPKKRARVVVKDEKDLPKNDLSIDDNKASIPDVKGFANAGDSSKFVPFRGFGVAGVEDLFFGAKEENNEEGEGEGEGDNGEVEEKGELGREKERESLLRGIGSWVEQEELRLSEVGEWVDEI